MMKKLNVNLNRWFDALWEDKQIFILINKNFLFSVLFNKYKFSIKWIMISIILLFLFAINRKQHQKLHRLFISICIYLTGVNSNLCDNYVHPTYGRGYKYLNIFNKELQSNKYLIA